MSELGQQLLATGRALLATLDADDRAELRGLLESLDAPPTATAGCPHEGADRLLDVTEKAIELGLHPDTLSKMARETRIWARKVGREWRFRPGDLPDPPQSRHGASQAAVIAGTRRRRAHPQASVAAIRGG